MYRYGIVSMADAPCGAMEWQRQWLQDVLREIPCFSYTGVDVVDFVVAKNVREMEHYPGVTFHTADLTRALPGGPYDLILSRDTMQHLPLASVADLLEQYWCVCMWVPGVGACC